MSRRGCREVWRAMNGTPSCGSKRGCRGWWLPASLRSVLAGCPGTRPSTPRSCRRSRRGHAAESRPRRRRRAMRRRPSGRLRSSRAPGASAAGWWACHLSGGDVDADEARDVDVASCLDSLAVQRRTWSVGCADDLAHVRQHRPSGLSCRFLVRRRSMTAGLDAWFRREGGCYLKVSEAAPAVCGPTIPSTARPSATRNRDSVCRQHHPIRSRLDPHDRHVG